MSRLDWKPAVLPGCDRVRRVCRLAVRSVGHSVSPRIIWDWASERMVACNPIWIIFEAQKVDDSSWLKNLRAISAPKLLVFTGDLPLEGIPERLAKLNVKDPLRIHVAMTPTEADEKSLLERLLLTLRSDQEEERILDAWWESDRFVIINPLFKRLHVPLTRLPGLAGAKDEDLRDFRIDEDGLYVYWPGLDIHLGWEQIAQVMEEGEYLRARQESREFNAEYGRAIRAIRERHQIVQSDVPGLTPRQVGRIERGQCRATLSALRKLARRHKMALGDYLNALAGVLREKESLFESVR